MKLDDKTHFYITIAILVAFLVLLGVCAALLIQSKPVPDTLWLLVSGAFTGMIGMIINPKGEDKQ